jgi:hypothetical protein
MKDLTTDTIARASVALTARKPMALAKRWYAHPTGCDWPLAHLQQLAGDFSGAVIDLVGFFRSELAAGPIM